MKRTEMQNYENLMLPPQVGGGARTVGLFLSGEDQSVKNKDSILPRRV